MEDLWPQPHWLMPSNTENKIQCYLVGRRFLASDVTVRTWRKYICLSIGDNELNMTVEEILVWVHSKCCSRHWSETSLELKAPSSIEINAIIVRGTSFQAYMHQLPYPDYSEVFEKKCPPPLFGASVERIG